MDQTRPELELGAGSDPAGWKSRFESRREELARRGVDVGLAERKLQELQALERARELVDG